MLSACMRKVPGLTAGLGKGSLYCWPNSVFGEEAVCSGVPSSPWACLFQHEDICSQCGTMAPWNCFVCLEMSTGRRCELAGNRDVQLRRPHKDTDLRLG